MADTPIQIAGAGPAGINIAAFAHPQELMRRQMQSHHIPYIPVGWAVMRHIRRIIGVEFEAIAPVNTIQKVAYPVLLVHGCDDSRVPICDAKAIYAHRVHNRVELLTLPGADHISIEHMELVKEDLVSFLQRVMIASHS